VKFNPSVLVPAKWEELPLSVLHRESLRRAVINLPLSLGNPKTALDDDEVVGFTQHGGWQKINSLLSLQLQYRQGSWFYTNLGGWIDAVRDISDFLKVSHSSSRQGNL
jgi:hypothetical protein